MNSVGMQWSRVSGLAMPHLPIKWRQSIAGLAALWAGILLLFRRDVADMVLIWWNSSTFNHCLLIIPILIWLVSQRRAILLQLTPRSFAPALLYTAVGAGGWLLGDAAGVAVARQLGVIMMLQGAIAAVLGLNVARGLLFPLLYMFFLVPIGEEAVPILQTVTAKMCMFLLGLTGIPAHIDGIFITTPTGYFKVAEACSGVKFLVAMVAYGALVSNLCFATWRRRALFMAVCIFVPVIANGIRAFGTIYIAHFNGIAFAASFDHVFYGWIFFAVVIAVVMACGWRYFDKRADAVAFDPAQLQREYPFNMGGKAIIAAVLAVVATPLLWANAIAAQSSPVPAQIYLPEIAGWDVVPYRPQYDWRPNFAGVSHSLLGRYRRDTGEEVDLFIAVYDKQSEGRELIGFGQGAVAPQSKWAWTADIPAPRNAKAERITAPGPIPRDVISFYRVNGVTSGSSAQIKLATLKARLTGGDQQAVAVMISAEHNGTISPRPAIDAFLADIGDVDKLADRMAGLD